MLFTQRAVYFRHEIHEKRKFTFTRFESFPDQRKDCVDSASQEENCFTLKPIMRTTTVVLLNSHVCHHHFKGVTKLVHNLTLGQSRCPSLEHNLYVNASLNVETGKQLYAIFV